MTIIRSLEDPDPVQRYMQRVALIRSIVLCVIVVLFLVALYWGFFL